MLNKGANGKLGCSQVLWEQEAMAATLWFSPHLQGIIPWAQQNSAYSFKLLVLAIEVST